MAVHIPTIVAAAAAALALGACEESGSTGEGAGAGGGGGEGSGSFTLRPQTLATKANLNPIAQAVQMFEVDMNRLPTEAEGLDVLLTADAIQEGDESSWNGPYLQQASGLEDPYGNPVEYERSGEGFVIRSLGADGQPGGTGSSQDIELRK